MWLELVSLYLERSKKKFEKIIFFFWLLADLVDFWPLVRWGHVRVKMKYGRTAGSDRLFWGIFWKKNAKNAKNL